MIMRRLDNLGSRPPILNINAEALVRLRALRTRMQSNKSNVACSGRLVGAANLMIKIIQVVNFVALRGTVGRSETTESRRIHLLLQ